jgi:hypothetical protein
MSLEDKVGDAVVLTEEALIFMGWLEKLKTC